MRAGMHAEYDGIAQRVDQHRALFEAELAGLGAVGYGALTVESVAARRASGRARSTAMGPASQRGGRVGIEGS
jgi:hypothetical protein